MSEYRYPNCLPQVPPPNFNDVHQNFDCFQNDNSRETINDHNRYQNRKNIASNNSGGSHRSNFTHDNIESRTLISKDSYFSHSNDVVASNPFETNTTCENGPFASRIRNYHAPSNQFQNLNHRPSGDQIYPPSYNIPNSEFHAQNNTQFQNRANSPSVINATSISERHITPNTPQNTCNIDSSVNMKSHHNVNHQSRPLNHMPGEVPFPQSENNRTGLNIQLSHHPEALNLSHFQENIRPNLSTAKSIIVRPNIPHPHSVNIDIHRPVNPYANNTNLLSNAQAPFPFIGHLPPNIPPVLPPLVSRSEQNRPVANEMYPINSQPVPQNFDAPPVIPVEQIPSMSYDTCAPFSLPPLYPIPTEMPSLPQNHFIPSFSGDSTAVNFNTNHFAQLTENKLIEYLSMFEKKPFKNNGNKNIISIAEFRSKLKFGITLLKRMQMSKSDLTELTHVEDNLWDSKIQEMNVMKDQILEICSDLSNSVKIVHEKLKKIKKKRNYKKRQKKLWMLSKEKSKQNREELHHKIDRWLDMIKEKNLKLKRETEMKKEADDILAEVRRKISEAKRTLEKLKAFEKLRNARKENAAQKSHFVLPIHNEKFEEKVSLLRNTMLKQLADYEGEERALKVMLETEQEGQLEEEARWRIKRLKQFQKRRQKDILEALFGTTEEPLPSDPLYLFYQHYNIGNMSIENLVQIRHHWDIFLVPPDCEEASTVPQQWIAPEQPQNASWENVKRE